MLNSLSQSVLPPNVSPVKSAIRTSQVSTLFGSAVCQRLVLAVGKRGPQVPETRKVQCSNRKVKAKPGRRDTRRWVGKVHKKVPTQIQDAFSILRLPASRSTLPLGFTRATVNVVTLLAVERLVIRLPQGRFNTIIGGKEFENL